MTEDSPRLRVVPVTLSEANLFVSRHHRHHPPARGCRFCVGAELAGALVGVAIAGRPVARLLDDGETLEVVRLCCDGTPNAPSMLLGAVRRAARALGYTRAITYTLPAEGGASLLAAGWRRTKLTGGGQWSRPSRLRKPAVAPEQKLLWDAWDPAEVTGRQEHVT